MNLQSAKLRNLKHSILRVAGGTLQTRLIFVLMLLFGGAAASSAGAHAARLSDFTLETLVDFADDALESQRPLRPEDLDAYMSTLARMGFRRVSWIYYADGRGGFLIPAGFPDEARYNWSSYAKTSKALGNPLALAVAAGHRHGLEVYACFRPYETGPGVKFPSGSPAAARWGLLDSAGGRLGWLDPFVVAHPELRIKRRTDDWSRKLEKEPVASIRLVKKDDAPTRLKADRIQIWVSEDNFRYQRADVKFNLRETVEAAVADVHDHEGRLLTRRGDPVRILTLSGLTLTSKYLLITTDFTEGEGDFANSGLALLSPQSADGRVIPGVFATGGAIWSKPLVDFREGGLMFDYGWGAASVTLDQSNADGRHGIIAFARGYNEYLDAALCETEPAVRAFWLQCIEEMIAAGVDGVDIREENHSTHTDTPENYGYNEVVLAAARMRPGDLIANIAAVRGEAYTEFLRACKARLAAVGKPLRYQLQLDFFRQNPPPNRRLAFPANVRFEWRRWLEEGILDAAVLRFYSLPFAAVFEDEVAQEMIARCRAAGVPLTVNRYVRHAGDSLGAELARVRTDGRFAGFIFYEGCHYLRFGPVPGECQLILPAVERALAGCP